ncbi:hypothetical protein [Lysinibacillus contaminans]|nr:hypothetical protein [Lysinibacillus contaminans]
MNISVARPGTLPHGGELTDGLDIDRWENDGGRSLSTRQKIWI